MKKDEKRLAGPNNKSVSEKIETDPNGSYTGRPKDPADRPIQDADDL